MITTEALVMSELTPPHQINLTIIPSQLFRISPRKSHKIILVAMLRWFRDKNRTQMYIFLVKTRMRKLLPSQLFRNFQSTKLQTSNQSTMLRWCKAKTPKEISKLLITKINKLLLQSYKSSQKRTIKLLIDP